MLALTRGRTGLDEPSLGLAPIVTREIFRVVREVDRAGTAPGRR